MRFAVDRELATAGDVRIPLSRRRTGVAQEVLDDFQISAALKEMGSTRMAQRVWPEPRRSTFEDAANITRRHRLTSGVRPERRPVYHGRQPRPNRIHGWLRHRHDSFNGAFPHHQHGTSAKVEAVTVEPSQLGDAQPGAVQQLKDGAIPERGRIKKALPRLSSPTALTDGRCLPMGRFDAVEQPRDLVH